jgi:hypothetical protein
VKRWFDNAPGSVLHPICLKRCGADVLGGEFLPPFQCKKTDEFSALYICLTNEAFVEFGNSLEMADAARSVTGWLANCQAMS